MSKIPPLIVIESSVLGHGISGMERWLLLFIDELNRQGAQYELISYHNSVFNRLHLNEQIYFLWLPVILWLKYRKIDYVFFVPNNVSKLFFKPYKKTIYFLWDLIPLSTHSSLIKRSVYRFKLNQIKNAIRVFVATKIVNDELIQKGFKQENIKILGSLLSPEFNSKNENYYIFKKLRLPKNYLLAVGTLDERKNLSVILKAYKSDTDRNLPTLVLYGQTISEAANQKFFEYLKENNLEDRVIHVGKLAAEELKCVYKRAEYFVFSSLAEGFGLPPLECLACGGRVICSDLPVLREVYGNSVAYFDPHSEYDFLKKFTEMREGLKRPSNNHKSLLQRYHPETIVNSFISDISS